MSDFFPTLIARIQERGVASASELQGCSADDIAALESRFGVRLPAAYRRYLELMGRASGKLFTHDHIHALYGDVLDLNAEPPIPLPAGALIISARLLEQFEFIRCDSAPAEDTIVWYRAEWDDQAVESHASVTAWLSCWCEAAEEAIASGYFVHNPRGTTG